MKNFKSSINYLERITIIQSDLLKVSNTMCILNKDYQIPLLMNNYIDYSKKLVNNSKNFFYIQQYLNYRNLLNNWLNVAQTIDKYNYYSNEYNIIKKDEIFLDQNINILTNYKILLCNKIMNEFECIENILDNKSNCLLFIQINKALFNLYCKVINNNYNLNDINDVIFVLNKYCEIIKKDEIDNFNLSTILNKFDKIKNFILVLV